MRRVFVLTLALACACGRLGFDRLDAGGPSVERLDGAVPPCDAADPGLEACYAFENDGLDGSGHGRDLVLEGTHFISGTRGMALARAASSRVAAPSTSPLAPTALTIDLWVRADEMPSGRAGLVDKAGQFGLFVHAGGEIRCTAGAAVSCGGLEPGAWRHIACTSDGTALRLYLDGVACDEVPSAGTIPAGDAALHLGEDSANATEGLAGAIDSVRVWSRALSPEEICHAGGC